MPRFIVEITIRAEGGEPIEYMALVEATDDREAVDRFNGVLAGHGYPLTKPRRIAVRHIDDEQPVILVLARPATSAKGL